MTGGEAPAVSPRAREMLARLTREWADAGLRDADRVQLDRVGAQVMAERSVRFADEHHPAFLHPLRSSTLLLEFGATTPDAHLGVLLLDSEPDSLGGGLPDPPDPLPELADLAADELLEWLLLGEGWVRSAWLAERLDHLRHLHLWSGPTRAAAALERAETREAPLAAREGGRCARAWADWMSKAHRFRLAERAEVRPVRTVPQG